MSQRIAVGLSEEPSTIPAFVEAAERARSGLAARADLCVAFVGAGHLGAIDDALAEIENRLEPRAMIGCGAAGVVASRREVESGAGVVVWAAELPNASIETFEIDAEPGTQPESLTGLPDPGPGADAAFLLCDPRRSAADAILSRFNEDWPGTPVLGGLASAAPDDGALLVRDGATSEAGAVGCLLGGVDLTPCVSQGATPVGPEMTITEGGGNVIRELASKPALERLGEVIGGLEPEQREQASGGLLLGVVIDENRPEHERGDFLVRPIAGADRESGAIVIGEHVRIGQTLRLHIRDAGSADADLREALALQNGALGARDAAGALLFTCNGRGRGLFGVADHDAEAVDDALDAPVGGFFCAGEIGPVGGRNFLHGFTATLAVFAG